MSFAFLRVFFLAVFAVLSGFSFIYYSVLRCFFSVFGVGGVLSQRCVTLGENGRDVVTRNFLAPLGSTF